MPRWDGADLYWTEGRPDEAGRQVIVRRNGAGPLEDVTPPGFNARTRVHEYGGGHYAVHNGTVWFINFDDQRLYRQDRDGQPRAITPAVDIRHADMVIDPNRRLIYAVREDHATSAPEAVNSLVALDWNGERDAIEIASGNDFYASPRLSPDGKRLAWLTWHHPNMPWDGCELWIGDVDADGRVKSSKNVAGGPTESIIQPEWSPNGHLFFISDRSDWWNLYRLTQTGDAPVSPHSGEFGAPQWVFGSTYYGFLDANRIISAYSETGGSKLVILDLADGAMRTIDLYYSSMGSVVVGRPSAGGEARVALIAASPTLSSRLITLDADSTGQEVVKVSTAVHLDPGYFSIPHSIEFKTEGGLTAHAFHYPPKNRDFEPMPGEKPPLVVKCHGGPTSAVSSAYSLSLQYWTSRGFAVVDVNYGGSSGFGRAYRLRLNGNWGVVDVDDCVNAARHLVERGEADPDRVAITGGSAGGFTTLLALTKRKFFKAGASHFGLGDLETFIKVTHKFESRYLDTLVGPYPKRADLYKDRSAVNFADDLNCPVILFQGLEDKVVPPSQAEEFVEVCKQKKLPYAYIAFEGEQHGFRQDKNIKRSIEGELDFYSQVFDFAPADHIEPVEIENF